jgi:DNA-binding CsgD family transcriptional regulator
VNDTRDAPAAALHLHARGTPPLRPLGLNTVQTATYVTVLRLRRASLAELAAAVQQPEERLHAELATLIHLGLVEHRAGEYTARHPGEALSRLVTERLNRLAAENRGLDDLFGSVRALMDRYNACQEYQAGEFSISPVRGADELFRNISALAPRGPATELACAVPDLRTVDDFTRMHAPRWIDAQAEGRLRLTVIVPVEALRSPGVRDRVADLVAAGGRVRTLNRVPSWFLTIGDRAAGLPPEWGSNLPENAYHCYLVRSSVIVALLRSFFAELWTRAVPVAMPGQTDGTRQVLRLASQGLCDESIARQLGVSVRTVRSRFAEAMTELGVQSRFQAGVEAARRGWLA